MFEKFFLLLFPLYYCSSINQFNLKYKALHDAVELVTVNRDRCISDILHLVTSLEEAKVVLCSLIIKQIQSEDYSGVTFQRDLKDLILQKNEFFNNLVSSQVDDSAKDDESIVYICIQEVSGDEIILSSDSLGYHLLRYDILYVFTIGSHLKQEIIGELLDFMNNSEIFTRLDFRVLWFLNDLPEHFHYLACSHYSRILLEFKEISREDLLQVFSTLVKALLNLFSGKPVDMEQLITNCEILNFNLSDYSMKINDCLQEPIDYQRLNMFPQRLHIGNPLINSKDFKIFLFDDFLHHASIASCLSILENNHQFSPKNYMQAMIILTAIFHRVDQIDLDGQNYEKRYFPALISGEIQRIGNVYAKTILSSPLFPTLWRGRVSLDKFLGITSTQVSYFFSDYQDYDEYQLEFIHQLFQSFLHLTPNCNRVEFDVQSSMRAISLMRHGELESILGEYFDEALLQASTPLDLVKILIICQSADINRASKLLNHPLLNFQIFFQAERVESESHSFSFANYHDYSLALITLLPRELQTIIVKRLNITKPINIPIRLKSLSDNLTTKCIYLSRSEVDYCDSITITPQNTLTIPDLAGELVPFVIASSPSRRISPLLKSSMDPLSEGDVIYVFSEVYTGGQIIWISSQLRKLILNHGGSLIYAFCEKYSLNAFLVIKRDSLSDQH